MNDDDLPKLIFCIYINISLFKEIKIVFKNILIRLGEIQIKLGTINKIFKVLIQLISIFKIKVDV